MADVNLFLSFGAGFMSFISPCCLPLYPAFVSYLTGVSVGKLKTENVMLRRRSLWHTVCFLFGFSVIFVALGFSTSWIGNFFKVYQDLIRQLGAVFFIFFGFMIAGLIKPAVLMKDYRFRLKNRPLGYLGSFLTGLVFAAGWTPCTGPILASVIYLGLSHPGSAIAYMAAYVLGFSIPFFVLSCFIGHLKWIRLYSMKLVKIGGYMMIAVGIMLFFDWMAVISGYLSTFFGGFQGF
ncbi:cytochrome c biogenesis CcdA family protein [Heyndrickxia acidiproducens]|jgi:cytochrome c-type biogenesis protein|uniref:cytochrome c biogenesis CcdA family protein n=1 Tax=Heyndrickxia acidiproducens TaxID=1121084 RepID=UPI000376F17F|nr:cytochrome c biogenesis protein CcdA [Heyndrickxia acidiproducens]